MTFEWDERKNQANIRKHGIAFEDAVFVFQYPFSMKTFDLVRSQMAGGRVCGTISLCGLYRAIRKHQVNFGQAGHR